MFARIRVLLVVLLVCSTSVFGAVPEKPYGDLSTGDVLGATWLMGTFNVLYSWCQGASASMDITNAAMAAHIASASVHGCSTVASASALAAHTGNTSNPHSVTCAQVGADPSGSASAAQAAVQGNLDTHTGATAAHGATGAIVGTTNAQTLQNKTIDSTCAVADGAVASTICRDSELSAHTGLTNNPHSTTYAQVGADPAGSAATVQGNLNTHAALTNNPHSVTRAQTGGDAYDVTGFCPGTLPDAAVVFYLKVPRAFTLPINLTDSQAELLTATTGAKSFDIQKNGSSIGTISFGAGQTAGTFTFSSAVSFAAGDKIKIVSPSTADATLAGFSFALKGTY